MERDFEGLRIEPTLTLAEEEIDILMVRWNNEDNLLAAACSDGTVRIYEGGTCNFVRSLSCREEGDPMPVTSIRWRPTLSSAKTKNVLLAATASGGVYHWHATSGKSLHHAPFEQNQILASDYEQEGRFFAVGCKDFSVKVVDESTKLVVNDLSSGDGERIGHSNRVFGVKWIDENTLASGGWDNNIFLWDLRTGNVEKYMHGVSICGDAIDVHQHSMLIGNYNTSNQLQIRNWQENSVVHTCLLYTSPSPRDS